MEELRETAKSHFRAGTPQVQALAKNFFNSMDSDGDGRVDLEEFLSFMRRHGYPQMRNRDFFKRLDRDGNGRLGFWEVMTLYYIVKSGRPFCDCCAEFIPGIFFSCVICYNRTSQGSFSICPRCYRDNKCKHNHSGRRTLFLDNYTLLQAQRVSASSPRPSAADHHHVNREGERRSASVRYSDNDYINAQFGERLAHISQSRPTISSASLQNRVQSNSRPTTSSTAIVARNTATPSSPNTFIVNPSSRSTNYTNAIVPASANMGRPSILFKALEGLIPLASLIIQAANAAAGACTIM